METRTIPAERWIDFFDHFSQEHTGWMATIEVLNRDTGPQNIAEALPFSGISFDTKGTRPNTVEISVGDRLDRHVNHVVDMPLHIRQAMEDDGSIDLQIEPAQGPITLVHLHGPIH